MAVTATFLPKAGVLSVLGDSLNNNVVLGRDAAGSIPVSGGAVSVGASTILESRDRRMASPGCRSGSNSLTSNDFRRLWAHPP
jgi:hypothetical protein